jgi:hypothetical protein
MDNRNRAIIIQAILTVITIIALTWGTRYNWPDFVHVKHGLPLTWGVHTLVTIVGPVDTWEVNLTALTLDLGLWLALILLASAYLSRKLG